MKSKISGCMHRDSKVISKYGMGGFVGMTADDRPVSFMNPGVEVNRTGKGDNENPLGANRAGKSDQPQRANRADKGDQPQRVNRADKDYYNPPRVNREGKDYYNPPRVNRADKVDLPNRAAPKPKPRMRPEVAAPKPRMRPEIAAPKLTEKPARAKEMTFQEAARRNQTDEYIRNKMKPKKSLFGKKLFGKG